MELLQKVCVFPRPALRDPAMREKREIHNKINKKSSP